MIFSYKKFYNGYKFRRNYPIETLIIVHIALIVLGLCEEADLKAQMFSLAQMLIRIPNVQFCTEPAFLQNPC
jgi:hypothetical protein